MSRTNIAWKDVPRDNFILEHVKKRAEFTGESETAIIKDLLSFAVKTIDGDKPKALPLTRKKPTNDDEEMLAGL